MLVFLVSLLSRLLVVRAEPNTLLACKKSLEAPCDGNHCVQRHQVTSTLQGGGGRGGEGGEIKGVCFIALIDLSSVIML